MNRLKPCKCEACGDPIAGGKTKLCCHCYPKRMSRPLVKYPWTIEWDRMLRDAYSRCVLGKPTVAIDQMERVTGYPRYIIKLRAQLLGVTRNTRKPWRNAEIEFLRQHAGKVTPREIAKLLHRSHSSVICQMQAHNLRAAVSRGYSVAQLADVLGIGEQQVRKYLQREWLAMDAAHRITVSSVRHLLVKRMDFIDFRLANQKWLKEELHIVVATLAEAAGRAA